MQGLLVETVYSCVGDRALQIIFVYFPDYMDYFLLDPKTGELRTGKPLDKEALDDSTGVINITVRVSNILWYNNVQNICLRLSQ
jgi:hypothetical protein